MTIYRFILNSFKHYLKNNITISLGIAISTAIITGALIVGDSVEYSLVQSTHYRLGNITHAFQSNDHFFTQDLSKRVNSSSCGIFASSLLKLEGLVTKQGENEQKNEVQYIGFDHNFNQVTGHTLNDSLRENEVMISMNIAQQLKIKQGDYILIRIKKANLMPMNTPFVSDDRQTVSVRVLVKSIASKENLGRFNLKNSQTAPFNVFMNIDYLNSLMELKNRANIVILKVPEDVTHDQLKKEFKKNWSPNDAGLNIKLAKEADQWQISSDKVFIDENMSHSIIEKQPGLQPILTYFVNSFIHESKKTPYSFISTLSENKLQSNEIIVNRWLADDLGIDTGSMLRIKFFVIGPLRKLVEKEDTFYVKDIVPLSGNYLDPGLMPSIPGLSDAGNCRDWETGIPVNLNDIRDKDEDYWDQYRGTPKAFISLSKAVNLWENRFGRYTALRIDSNTIHRRELEQNLKNSIDPFQQNIILNPLKKEGLKAAKEGVDFSQLFLGLSFFILISGILLTALLFVFNLEQRRDQLGTLTALGFDKTMIQKIYLFEGILIAFVGIMLGLFLAIIYNKLVFIGLNRVWQDIVRTNVLEINIRPVTILTGGIISLIVVVSTMWITLHRNLMKHTYELQKKIVGKTTKKYEKFERIVMIIFVLTAIFLILYQLFFQESLHSTVFFILGALIMIILLILIDLWLRKTTGKHSMDLDLIKLSHKNLIRNRVRSNTVIILLCIGTFIVVSTGANRKNLFADWTDKTSGTGGFLFMAESTIPVLKNLNNNKVKQEFGISDSLRFVQFRVRQGDDASCLNLNRISNPRVLGVDPSRLSGRFSFVTKTSDLDVQNPWLSLNQDMKDVIPAIADQTVIQWSLGKKVGDTLKYTNAKGEEIYLKLIGGLAASVFQGYVLISNDHFLENYPSSSGSNVFLINGNRNEIDQYTADLNMVFRDYGWNMVTTVKKLMTFKSVENTYLSIFLVLGAFGLLLGTIGLAIVLARSLQERKSELALLVAAGFSKSKVTQLINMEYGYLLTLGILAGLLSSITAVFPTFISRNAGLSVGFVAILMAIIIINGVIWIRLISATQIKNLQLATALKNE